MSSKLRLPRADGSLAPYTPGPPSSLPRTNSPATSRIAFAAAHVVADPLAENNATSSPAIDWDATLAYRRHLWSLGLGVAEAMDTAQRGMGLAWPAARELIARSVAEAHACGGMIACGAGTDQLPLTPGVTFDQVCVAYEEQCAFVEGLGAQIILMASAALAACASSPEDYARVYDHILSRVSRPVILHWLGAMFDPSLTGYWGADDLDAATDVLLDIIRAHPGKVDGIKVSLLDAEREIEMRRRLPPNVRMYTGDDFNYADLILGDDERHSDALLGVFDAIAPAAAAALVALDAGNISLYRSILVPTVPLSRHIFQAPTRYYKTGVVFLAYLNGHQSHFHMIGGLQSARSAIHLSDIFVLADRANLLVDPESAARRLRPVLALAGIEA